MKFLDSYDFFVRYEVSIPAKFDSHTIFNSGETIFLKYYILIVWAAMALYETLCEFMFVCDGGG